MHFYNRSYLNNMLTSNSTKIRMPPPGGDASFGVSISMISGSLYYWLTRLTLTVFLNDTDSEFTFSTSRRKPLVWTLLEPIILWTSVLLVSSRALQISHLWALMAIRILP